MITIDIVRNTKTPHAIEIDVEESLCCRFKSGILVVELLPNTKDCVVWNVKLLLFFIVAVEFVVVVVVKIIVAVVACIVVVVLSSTSIKKFSIVYVI